MNAKNSISVLCITYNQQDYIRTTLRSIFEQCYEQEFEFVICDDCSSDNTDTCIKDELSRVPKHVTVKYFRHEENVGSVANFNFGLAKCSGDIVVVADGDDISSSQRLRCISDAFLDPYCMLVVSNANEVDEDGNDLGKTRYSTSIHSTKFDVNKAVEMGFFPIFGASYAFRKHLHEKFGEIDPIRVMDNNVDHIYFWRALSLGWVQYDSRPLIEYRVHQLGKSLRFDFCSDQGAASKLFVRYLAKKHNLIANSVYILEENKTEPEIFEFVLAKIKSELNQLGEAISNVSNQIENNKLPQGVGSFGSWAIKKSFVLEATKIHSIILVASFIERCLGSAPAMNCVREVVLFFKRGSLSKRQLLAILYDLLAGKKCNIPKLDECILRLIWITQAKKLQVHRDSIKHILCEKIEWQEL
ncbi:glycosyltransferase [Catenovulum agarivorans]|uniref:glycosyltransferase n=1 Tax=Catenovulum agarivorans TaxID=1172192 RepID=UPI000310B8BE|nr:glycosyltransferase [Catenovulum agarivorans]